MKQAEERVWHGVYTLQTRFWFTLASGLYGCFQCLVYSVIHLRAHKNGQKFSSERPTDRASELAKERTKTCDFVHKNESNRKINSAKCFLFTCSFRATPLLPLVVNKRYLRHDSCYTSRKWEWKQHGGKTITDVLIHETNDFYSRFSYFFDDLPHFGAFLLLFKFCSILRFMDFFLAIFTLKIIIR